MTTDELKMRRKRIGMTQLQLSRALGVTYGAVWLWESGRRPIPPLLTHALRAFELENRQRAPRPRKVEA